MSRQTTQIIVGAVILIGAFCFGSVAQRRHGDLTSPNLPPTSLEKEDLVWHTPENKNVEQSTDNSSADLANQSEQAGGLIPPNSKNESDGVKRSGAEPTIPQLLTTERPKLKPIVQPDFSSLASSLIAADSKRMRPLGSDDRAKPILAPSTNDRDSRELPSVVTVLKSSSPAIGHEPNSTGESKLVPIPNDVDRSLENTTETFRVHVTRYGDSLQGLARQYYGTPNYYLDIYLANQDSLTSPSVVPTGVTLKIPMLSESKSSDH